MAAEHTTPQPNSPLNPTRAASSASASRTPAGGSQSRADAIETDNLTIVPVPTAAAPVATTTGWLWGLLMLCACYGLFYLGGWATSRNLKPPLVGPFTTNATPGNAPAVIVHVAGAVAHPGVYHLRFDARITDAIHEAGGPLPNADTNALNLAAWIEDGTRIEVPTKAAPLAAAPQAAVPTQLPPQTAALERSTPTAASPAPETPTKVSRPRPRATKPPKSAASVPHATTPSGKTSKKIDPAYLAQHPINVNTAPATDLQELPGIGPAMAAKIIAYRQENGRFQAVDDLRNVKGIGVKKLAKLEPLVTIK